MSSIKLNKYSATLNTEQLEAYNSTGHCVVIAGPGSGKTKVLTVKLAKILNEEVYPPQRIACITYSVQCAQELKKRLQEIQVYENSRILVGTVHAFCLRHIVMPYARLAWKKMPEQIHIAPKNIQDSFFRKAVGLVLPDQNPLKCKDGFNTFRKNNLDRNADEWKNNEYAGLVRQYEKLLLEQGLMDFDLMIYLALRLVHEKEWIRRILSAKFPFLLVDEYQDLGAALHEMVLLLCIDGNSRLFAVGDPDQSIYGFNGACPERMAELTHDTDLVQKVQLRMNYRSQKKIISGSSAALDEERDFDSSHNGEGTVEHHSIPEGFEAQVRHAFNEILPAVFNRCPERKLGNIGVLYSTQYQGNDIARILKDEFPEYRSVRFDAGKEYARNQLTMWLEACAAWCSERTFSGEILLADLIHQWMNFFPSQKRDSEILQCRKELVLFLFNEQNQRPDRPLIAWLDSFKQFGLYDRLKSEPSRVDEFEALENLYHLCQDGGKLSQYTVRILGGQKGSPDHLNLTTIHSAKGLEYDVVIMLGLENGIIPRYDARNSPEQRRLFYVAMTRAKHEVHLLSSGWYKSLYGALHQDGHSPFIDDVLRRLDLESIS